MATVKQNSQLDIRYYAQDNSSNVYNSFDQVEQSVREKLERVRHKEIVRDQLTGNFIDNYIYLYHLPTDDNSQMGQFLVLPSWPENYSDTLGSTFSSENILARSAPIFAYSNSGPRQTTITLSFHRDMMTQINYGVSNFNLDIGDDYVDTLINKLQAIALPKYDYGTKLVNPPMVAVRFGNEYFIKGVVQGGITTSASLPLLPNGKYAQVGVQFTVYEVDPYDAETVVNQGMLRGLDTTLERSLYK